MTHCVIEVINTAELCEDIEITELVLEIHRLNTHL